MSQAKEVVMNFVCDNCDPGKIDAQITIDALEKIQEDFLNRDEEKEPIERDQVGAAAYDVGNICYVMDHNRFPKDYVVLNKLYKLLDEWESDIEHRNKILGIPIHKG